MKLTYRSTAVRIAVFALLGGVVYAQSTVQNAALAKRWKVSRAAAAAIALTWVPSGRIREGDLEEEQGRLVWSFDIAAPNSANLIEVQVDAVTGRVVSVIPETPSEKVHETAAERPNRRAHK